MKVLITEAINSAMNAFFDALGNDTYKEQYRETHFNPILIEYKRGQCKEFMKNSVWEDRNLNKLFILYKNF